MTEPVTIRILIVDDHDGVRLGLTTALATIDDLLVVGAANSGSEALRLCRRLRPDVVLMEIQLPDRDGIDLVRMIRRQFPKVQVVVLSSVTSTDFRQRAGSAGVHSYLSKYVAVDDLIAVIRAAYRERPAEDGDQ